MSIHHRIRIVLAALALASTLSVQARDAFFSGDGKHFVGVEILAQPDGERWVKFSGCEVQPTGLKAKCTDLSAIEAAYFDEMRGCERKWIAVDSVAGGLTGAAAVGGVVISVMSGGTLSALGFGAIMGAGGASVASFSSARAAYEKLSVYSEENATDEDWVSSSVDYDRFISRLKESLTPPPVDGKDEWDCNAYARSRAVDPRPYLVALTPEQLERLRNAARER